MIMTMTMTMVRRPAASPLVAHLLWLWLMAPILLSARRRGAPSSPSSSSLPSLPFADAYRIGDAVGILLRTQSPSSGGGIESLEAYRHQLPRFGVSTQTRFEPSSLLAAGEDGGLRTPDAPAASGRRAPSGTGERLRMSISFDEGLHRIPWLDVYDPSRRRALEGLVVTIVYSGSDGSIHAVHSEARHRDAAVGKDGGGGMPGSFAVEYVWVNEADVDVRGGMTALFLAVLIASLSGMVGACASTDEGGARGKKYKEKHSSSLEVESSSEGFAKRL